MSLQPPLRRFNKAALSIVLLLSSASSFATSLPNGLLGLKFGMSIEATTSTIRDIYGENGADIDDFTLCQPYADDEPDVLSCVVKGPGFKYAGVPAEGLGYFFIDGKLQSLYLVIKEPISAAEKSYQLAHVAAELAADLPMPKDLETASLRWQMSDNTALLVDNHYYQVTLTYTSREFGEMALKKEQRDQAAGVNSDDSRTESE